MSGAGLLLRAAATRAVGAFGLELRRKAPSAPQPRPESRLLERYGVEALFDVGANVGMSAQAVRRGGFAGTIVSFEPVSHLFSALEKAASADPLWEVENVALGAGPGRATIHVSGGHAGASSLLEMTENVRRHAPDQRVVGSEEIDVSTLDLMLEKHYPQGERCFLKLDVQGFEKRVLEGGSRALDRVVGIKCEMSVVENYRDETLMTEMFPYLYDLGFRLLHVEGGKHFGHQGFVAIVLDHGHFALDADDAVKSARSARQ
ncbi:MAG: FkbM family methyltransferase, partial [Acidobacteriota bacterium]